MACYHPLRVALDQEGQLDFSILTTSSTVDSTVLVPCRYCLGCMSGQARDWAIRCYHEALYHSQEWQDPETGISTRVPNNVMVTLTYNDESIPANGLLQHSHFQLFIKNLRYARSAKSTRYFMCGEYGGKTLRPHYHALLFGEHFDDRYALERANGDVVSCSHELDKLWGRGDATVDDLTFGTVRYVTGYMQKKTNLDGKFTGPLADFLSDETGELTIVPLSAEYRQMSRRPGLGHDWLEANVERIYPLDEIQINEQTFSPPGYYDRYLRKHYPGMYRTVQDQRHDSRIQSQIDWTPGRCASAEDIHSQRIRQDNL